MTRRSLSERSCMKRLGARVFPRCFRHQISGYEFDVPIFDAERVMRFIETLTSFFSVKI